MRLPTEIKERIQSTLAAHINPDTEVISIEQWQDGPQGYSGADVSYFIVMP